MRITTFFLLLTGCASVSSRPLAPDKALREIEEILACIEPAYEFKGGFLLESEDPRLYELLDKYKNDHETLKASFLHARRDVRIFSVHALSKSWEDGAEELYGQWLTEVLKDEGEVQQAWLEYASHIDGRVPVPVRPVLELLAGGYSRDMLLALRNGPVVTHSGALELFEAVLSFLRKGSDDEAKYAQDIMQTMTTVRRLRGDRFLEQTPLTPRGPMHNPVRKDREKCTEAWNRWWNANRDYVVWIPVRFPVFPKPTYGELGSGAKAAVGRIFSRIIARHRYFGGGFFILDKEARRAGAPTKSYRRDHPWKKGQGPLDPRLYLSP